MGRIIQGIGAGATLSMFRVTMRDLVKGKAMASLASYTTMLFNLSPVIGMIVGGYIVHYFNWQYCFWALVILYISFIFLYAFFCPETIQHQVSFNARDVLSHYKELLSGRLLILIAICSGLAFSIVFSFATSGAFIFQHHFHVSAVMFGWLGSTVGIACIVGKLFNAQAAKYLPLKWTMFTGMMVVFIAGAVLFVMHNTVVSAMIGIAFACGGTALILSNAMTRAMHAHHKNIGYVASIYGFIQIAVVFISNGILAHFHQYGLHSLSLFYVIAALISLALLLITWREAV